MVDPTDEELVQAYVTSKDMDALNQLVERHIGFVRGLLLGLALSASDADDLTQETFMKAIRGLPAYRGISGFRTWLYRIAVNTAHSHRRRSHASRLFFSSTPPDGKAAGLSPSDALITNEMESRLADAVERLSPCLRRAFLLVGVQGIEPREAAAMEGCLVSSMYRRVHTARKRLAGWLDGELRS